MKVGLRNMGGRALYQEYRRRLNARAVLEYYGAENVSEMSGAEGTTEVVHSCLIDRVEPHHSHGDRNPSACMNIDRKLYVCYSNGWSGDLFHFIAKMEGKETIAEALPFIGQFLEGSVVETDRFVVQLEQLMAEPAAGLIDIPTYHERVLSPWELIHPYLYEERGITVEAASALRLGYDERENRIVFPVFWEAQLIGWQKRTIPARPGQWPGTVPDYPKYRNSSGLPKSEVLYNYDRARTHPAIIVVESPMSVAKALSLGFESVVATFGAKVGDHQIDVLKDRGEVYIWFDSDRSGRSGELKLVEGLYRHTDVRVVVPEEDKDLGDYDTADEVLAMLAGAVPAVFRLPKKGRRR